jgi:hypothetical protein
VQEWQEPKAALHIRFQPNQLGERERRERASVIIFPFPIQESLGREKIEKIEGDREGERGGERGIQRNF